MQFLQLFSIFLLLLVHFDCSQATLPRSPSVGRDTSAPPSQRNQLQPLDRGYKRHCAKEAMKTGAKNGACVGVMPGAIVGLALGPLAIPLAASGAALGAGVGGAAGAAVGTVNGFRKQIKAKLEQRSKKPIGL